MMTLTLDAELKLTALFTKLPARPFSQLEWPQGSIPAIGSIHGLLEFQELYQAKYGTAGNCEAGGFVNSVVK